MTSDSRVGRGVPVQSLAAPNSDCGQHRVLGQAGNSCSARDVIESHDERAGVLSGEGITASRPGSSAVGRPADNTSSTRSNAVGPESRETYSSEGASPRYSRGNGDARIFYPSNTDSWEIGLESLGLKTVSRRVLDRLGLVKSRNIDVSVSSWS